MSDEVTLKDEYDLVGGGHVRYYKIGDAWSFEVNSNGDDDTDPEEITEAIDAWCSWHEYVLDNNLHIKDKKEAPPVEPSSKDRTDTPEFTPPGEGWKAGEPPLGTSDRYEVVQRWISGGMTATATYHRPLPKPIELPTEENTVSEVKWKTGRFSSTLLLREGRWFTVPHGAVSYTPEELAQKIDSYEVVSRPMAAVAKEVLDEMEHETQGMVSMGTVRGVTARLRKKWGVK